MPKSAGIFGRVPPRLREELQRLIQELDAELPASIRRPTQGDMVGVLIVAAREARDRLPSALDTYYEIKRASERS